jgi:hypothetical protein
VYWSGYDTAILLTGILTLAVALLPGTGLESRTRLATGGVGAALVVVAIITGNAQSLVYPSGVWIAPLLPVVAGVALIVRRQRAANQKEEEFANAAPVVTTAIPADPARVAASDPTTPLTRLADLAYDRPELRALIAANPATYPDLLDWLAELDDPAVTFAIQQRGHAD